MLFCQQVSEDAPGVNLFRVGFKILGNQSEPYDLAQLQGTAFHKATDAMSMGDWLDQLVSRIVVQDAKWQKNINRLLRGTDKSDEDSNREDGESDSEMDSDDGTEESDD
jgi:hypothetical protein